MSNGYTENSVEVFGTNDIESVPSLLEVNLNNYEVSKKYKLSDILSKLGVSSFYGFFCEFLINVPIFVPVCFFIF